MTIPKYLEKDVARFVAYCRKLKSYERKLRKLESTPVEYLQKFREIEADMDEHRSELIQDILSSQLRMLELACSMASEKLQWQSTPVVYTGDIYIALILHDQGGHPFTAIGYLYGKFTDDFTERNDALIKWLSSGRVGPKPAMPTLIPHLRVASHHTDQPLDSWWNIERWAELKTDTWISDAGLE